MLTVRLTKYKINSLEKMITSNPSEWNEADFRYVQDLLKEYKELLERGIEAAEMPPVFSKPRDPREIAEKFGPLPE